MKKLLIAIAAIAVTTTALTAPVSAAQSVEEQINAINEKYEPRFMALQSEGQAIAESAPKPSEFEGAVGISGEVDWEMTSIKFDIPEVVMKTREFSLHLPQFRMDTTSVKFDIPKTYFKITKVGEYPCFKGWKWYSCDIKTKVPQFRTETVEVKFDLPQVSWDITSFKMDIPEFFNKRVEWKLHLPQFTVKDVDVEIGKTENAAKDLEKRAFALGAAQKAEIQAVVAADLKDKRASTVAQFDSAIQTLKAGIAKVRSAGANPEAINANGSTQNMVAQLAELKKKRSEVLSIIDQKIAEVTQNAA